MMVQFVSSNLLAKEEAAGELPTGKINRIKIWEDAMARPKASFST
jgi:hypothetical protein